MEFKRGDIASHKDYKDSKDQYTENAQIISGTGDSKATYYTVNESLPLKDRNRKPDEGHPKSSCRCWFSIKQKKKHMTRTDADSVCTLQQVPAIAGCTCKQVFSSLAQLCRAWDIILQEIPKLTRLGYPGFFQKSWERKHFVFVLPNLSHYLLAHSLFNTQWTSIAYLGYFLVWTKGRISESWLDEGSSKSRNRSVKRKINIKL